MYHKLCVRFPGKCCWEELAVDDVLFDVVKYSDTPGRSAVYDIDGCLLLEVAMPFNELVAKLNGEEWDAKQPPEPVVVSRWAWVDLCGNLVYTGTEDEVKRCVLRASGYAVELKGEYTP